MSNASRILVFKKSVDKMKIESFQKIAETLEIKGKTIETDNGLAVTGSEKALAYAQPYAKFAGLLFYSDQSVGIADQVENLLDSQRAKRWADTFLRDFNLVPSKVKDERINLTFNLHSSQNEAIVFDGKERRKIKNKTEIRSIIKINDIPVVGPRAKVRMVFKNREKPILIHSCIWNQIEVYEEREIVRMHDVVKVVREKLVQRQSCKNKTFGRYGHLSHCDVISARLAYFANEYAGGMDLLAPYYFVEVEFEDPKAKQNGITQGPRQIFWLPAYR